MPPVSGLCGVLSLDGTYPDVGVVDSMVRAAPHRWRDGVTTHVDERLGVAGSAVRTALPPPSGLRTSICDDLVVVGDLRLDGRSDLLGRLGGEPLGADSADVDLVAAAFRRWGTECVQCLLGDYAFAVFDPIRRRLFLARDPMGQRPLVVRVEFGRRLLFASEVGQVLAAPGVLSEIDERSVAAHLVGAVLPVDMTFYRGIRHLAPGTSLEVSSDGRQVQRSWWRPEELDPIRHRRDEEYEEHFRELFSQAVGGRLDAKGPVGVLLSGGIDSGAVASTAGYLRESGRTGQQDLRAYTWGFRELVDCDERSRSNQICRRYGLAETVVWGDHLWTLSTYPDDGADLADPFLFTGSELVTATLGRAAVEGTAALIPGTCGDFVIGGLVRDELGPLRSGRPRRWALEMRAAHSAGLPWGSVGLSTFVDPLMYRLGRTSGGLGLDRSGWLTDELRRASGVDQLVRMAERLPAASDRARAARLRSVRSPALHRIIAMEERLWARAGVAYVDPWSDRRLVEYVAAAQPWRVHSWAEPKRLVRRALETILPDAVRLTPSLNDFASLHERGFRVREVETVRDLLAPGSIVERRGWVDGPRVRAEYEGYLAGEPGRYVPLKAIELEAWMRRWHQ